MSVFIKKPLMELPKANEDLVILCTTNGCIHRGRQALVMGKGAALTMKSLALNSDRMAAIDILKRVQEGIAWFRGSQGTLDIYEYYLCKIGKWNGATLGGIQVKAHFAQKADLDIMRESLSRLETVAVKHPFTTFRLNYPGIGAGGLSKAQVLPMIDCLPNNVEVVSL